MSNHPTRPDGRRPDELRPVIVMTDGGRLIEVQGTAEGAPFSRETLNCMLDLAAEGIAGLIEQQREALV